MTSNTSEHDADWFPSIAFIGKMGSGKTTAAEFLEENYGYIRKNFAGLLKDVAAQIWGDSARTDRDKLQKLGKAVRDIDEGAWCNALIAQVEGTPTVVIDDCRFPNEYWALKQQGFQIVRIMAPEVTRITRLQKNGKLQDTSQLNHESELALDTYSADHAITNSRDVDEFKHEVAAIVEKELTRV